MSFDEIYLQIVGKTLVSRDRCLALYNLAKSCALLPGCFYECGVYKGGTAFLLAQFGKTLKLFDSFEGLPEPNEYDLHKKGDFADTNAKEVARWLSFPNVEIHQGWLPYTFPETDLIAFAHVDVDLYQSVWDCCEFIVPRLAQSGVIVFDDYGFPSCPGAKKAVDDWFGNYEGTPDRVQRLPTGQAVYIQYREPRDDY
jgi:O-methyltransferase